MSLPLSQGTISNWTIDSKAVSWTDVGYSFIISSSIKQVNGLELFVFGSCCSEPTSCGQRSSPCKRNRQLFGFKNTNSSERLGAAQSSVCYIRMKRPHWWAQQHKRPGHQRRTTVVEDLRIKRRTLSRRQTCLKSREDFTRANTEASPHAANEPASKQARTLLEKHSLDSWK